MKPVIPPPGPADVGLVAALPIEIAPFLSRLREVRKYKGPRYTITEGECLGRLVAIVVTGPGRKLARRGAELLIAGHRPSWVVSAGFAGGLAPDLRRNDVLLASEILDEDGGRFTIDLHVPPPASGIGPRFLSGRLLTVDRIIRTAAEKANLRRRFEADAVDMETSAVAQVCGERGVRFLPVRVISDEAGTDLPPEVLSILGGSGGYRVGAAFGAIWRRPSSVMDLLSLREHAQASARRLAEILPGILSRLP